MSEQLRERVMDILTEMERAVLNGTWLSKSRGEWAEDIVALLATPEHFQPCVVCGKPVDTREIEDGGAPHGASLADGRLWACSREHWERAARMLDATPERGGPVCVKCGRPKWQGGLCPMSSATAAEHVYGTQVEPAPDAGDADATPHHVSGSVTRIIEGHGATLADAIKDWQSKAGGGYPLWAWEGDDDDDGREIIAGCEDCGLPIFEGENFGRDGQGIYWHIGCGDD